MATVTLPLIKGDKIQSGAEYRDFLPTNMIAIKKSVLDADGYMRQFFGITSIDDGYGVDRGAIWVSRDDFAGHYRVSGSQLIKIDSDGTINNLGLIPGDDNVSMAYSFNNLAIVADNSLYYYNPTDGLREITDTEIGAPIDITWLDSYFVLTDGEYIFHSEISNEESFAVLDYGTAEFQPDPSLGVDVNEDDELVVFGSLTIERFYNAGNENFVFTRIRQKSQKIGVCGTHARKEVGGNWYTISRRKEGAFGFYVLTVGAEEKLSTTEIDRVINTYTSSELESASVDSYMIDGHQYVQFNLPNHTFIYSATLAEAGGLDYAWSIASTDGGAYSGINAVHNPESSKVMVGSATSSSLGYIDKDTSTHYGEMQEFELTTPFVKMESLSINELSVETASGDVVDDDAAVAVSITFDGRTYTKEWWNLYGEQYDYRHRFIIRRLGYAPNWCGFKLRGKCKSPISFLTLTLDAS